MNDSDSTNNDFKNAPCETQFSGLIESEDLGFLKLDGAHPEDIYDLLDRFL